MIRSKGEGGEKEREKQRRWMKKGKKRGKRQKMEIKVTGKLGGKIEERMREGKRMEKRMIRGKRRGNGERKQGGGQKEKLDGKRVGEENDEEEGRGEVIGVCLYTYIYFFTFI